MNARVIFSKDFLDKTKGEELTAHQKGKIYFERLTELDNSGELAKAKDRKDVVNIVGYNGEKDSGYSWVSNLVRRGHLSETLVGIEDGKKIFEYHLARKHPIYGKKRRTKKVATVEDRTVQLQKIHDEARKHCVVGEDKPQLTIKYGKVEIFVGEGATVEYLVDLLWNINQR